MKKYQLDLQVKSVQMLSDAAFLLTLTYGDPLPEMAAGQFAELLVEGSNKVMLRRPISIHKVDIQQNTVEFMIQIVGEGTRTLSQLKPGDKVNTLLPLGNGFSYKDKAFKAPLLVGGGVGIAPLLHLGQELNAMGIKPTFLFGGRSSKHILRPEEYELQGRLFVTTEDASMGEKGFVTDHTLLGKEQFDIIFACGPTPMLKSVARFAEAKGIECQVSLEHKMACGIGACLCCVEDTNDGNVCVCKEGPVFDIKRLKWLH
ncbi:MAG: dihydroorotate dehydrogenase electron transfer subunit [Bacteroidaceae bacterium]|nr:dihydroorotate dehydrogenase electron transfer subunit [Bacteroidaceae bacterium]